MSDIKRTFCGEVEISHTMISELASKYHDYQNEGDDNLLAWEVVVPIIQKVHEMVRRSERNAVYTIINEFAGQLKLDNKAREQLLELAEDRMALLTE